jgi:bacteriorhodopsin
MPTVDLPDIPFENFFTYSPMAFEMASHMLTLTYAAMLAGLLYFALTLKSVAPKYRISSVLSVVVMTSAFLLLYKQAQNWTDAFIFSEELGRYIRRDGADIFTNGYRYLNWLIDVPMLLFQVLFVVNVMGIGGETFKSLRNKFFVSGSLMVITGYIGQYYEVSNLLAFFVWGTISTVFFVHLLLMIRKVLKEGQKDVTPKAASYLNTIWILFLISWMLYPGAYLMPVFTDMSELILLGGTSGLTGSSAVGLIPLMEGDTAVVARTLTYSVADITSKIIYGIFLTLAAQERSKQEEGYLYDDLTTSPTLTA